MEILQRFKLQGQNAYMVLYSGTEQPVAVVERGLYDYTILEELRESGYKIKDYHGNIIAPDGTNIKDIIETQVMLTPTAEYEALALGDIAISEAEASQFFDRTVEVEEIKFKEPKIEINTREELLRYLDKQNELSSTAAVIRDIRPLNSFVNPDALFSFNEIVEQGNIAQRYMQIIENRRILKSYQEYERLIAFLKSEGVLGDNYTPNEIKDAYLSWGVCGLKGSLIKSTVKVGVTVPITSKVENVTEKYAQPTVMLSKGLLGKDGIIYYRDQKINVYEHRVDNFIACDIKPLDKSFTELLDNTSSWGSDFVIIDIQSSIRKNRTYLTFLTEEGVTYNVKVDDNNMVIIDAGDNIVGSYSYIIIKTVDGEKVTLKHCTDKETFDLECLARAKARTLMKSKRKECPVENSYELIKAAGVGPKAALGYGGLIMEETAKSNATNRIPYSMASQLYYEYPGIGIFDKQDDFYRYIYEQFNPKDIDFEDIDELIDIFIEERDHKKEEGTYLPGLGKKGSDRTQNEASEVFVRPVDVLEFAKNFKNGAFSVGNFDKGSFADKGGEILEAQDLLITALYALGKMSDAVNTLSVIESYTELGLDSYFKERTGAYNGYIQDTVILNGTRADQCDFATVVTGVYREASNKPIEEQRHYMAEMLALPLSKGHSLGRENKKKYIALKECILSAFESYNETVLAGSLKSIIIQGIGYHALTLAFGMLNGTIKPKNITLSGKIYSRQIYPGVTVDIDVPMDICNHFSNKANYAFHCPITLFDWNNVEFVNGRFQLFCLNATITPWEVIPHKGVKVPTYNWIINYLRSDGVGVFTKEIAASLRASGAKNRDFSEELSVGSYGTTGSYLMPRYTSANAFSSVLNDPDSIFDNNKAVSITYQKYNKFKANAFNDVDVLNDEIVGSDRDEFPEVYTKRFLLNNKAVKADNKTLLAVPLASDIYFATDYDDLCQLPKVEGVQTIDGVDVDVASNYRTLTDVSYAATVDDDKFITSKTTRAVPFKFAEQDFNNILAWSDLYQGTWIPKGECIIRGKNIIICSTVTGKAIQKNIETLTSELMDALVAKGIAYQLSGKSYLVKCMNGDYSIEVK